MGSSELSCRETLHEMLGGGMGVPAMDTHPSSLGAELGALLKMIPTKYSISLIPDQLFPLYGSLYHYSRGRVNIGLSIKS